MRPQHLTQVAHEGNPVECSIEVLASTGGLESPNPFDADGADLGGPVLYPRTGSGGAGGDDVGGGDNPANQPILLSASGPMDCFGNQSVTFTVTGGVAPFSWGTTLGVITPSGDGKTATLTPPANTGSSYPGTAFTVYSKYMQGSCTCACQGVKYDCAGDFIDCTPTGGNSCLADQVAGGHCSGFVGSTVPDPVFSLNAVSPFCPIPPAFSDTCAGAIATHQCTHDERSADQISNGCNPCQVSFTSAVITVTDGQGHQAYAAVEHT